MKYYLVDDDIGTIKSLESIIKSKELGSVCGYSTDPVAAISEILDDKPDIVLVDLLMNDMDGIELVTKVRSHRQEIAFVMISKVLDKEMIGSAYKAGVEFFINKPINIIEVEKVLNNVSDNIKMRGIMTNIQDMFDVKKPVQEQQSHEKVLKDAEFLLSMLGLMGEKGTKDIQNVLAYMIKNSCEYSRLVLGAVSSETNDTPKNIEQRMRRAIKKGLTNVANAGIDDYGNEMFSEYASYVYDFKNIKEEMNYIQGKSSYGGRVNVSKFVEGLKIYCLSN